MLVYVDEDNEGGKKERKTHFVNESYIDDHHGVGEVADKHLHEPALAVLPDQPGKVEAGCL